MLALLLQIPNVIDGTMYSVRLGAMRAAVKRVSSFDSVADYLATTMCTDRRKFMYRTLERIEYMSISGRKHLKRKVVIISANFALSHNVSFLCIIFSYQFVDATRVPNRIIFDSQKFRRIGFTFIIVSMDLVRWGIIGAGDIVRKRIAPAMVDLPNCEFTAVARAQGALAESFAKEFGAKRGYSDWREMLSDGGIDAIYVATPVFLHAEQTIAAAEAGKHVLCEKPMAIVADECERMIAACESNGVKLGVAYYRRFYPVLARVRDLLASGEIGHPTLAQINAFEYVELEREDSRGWFVDKGKSGGGPMMDFGCHRIEVLTDLFGSVSRIQSLRANTFFDREVEDTAVALLEFDSRTIGSVSVTHAAREPQDTLDIYGTKGSLHIPMLNKGDIIIRTADGDRTESHPPHANIHQPLVADFADSVLSGREPRVGGSVGLLVAGIEDKIYGRA